MPSRGSPDHGLEVQGSTQTLEYLNAVSVFVSRYAKLQTGLVTGKRLRDAGIQVLRRPDGGHSHLYWPTKIDTPIQCFNCMQAAKQVMGVEGWQQAVGLDAAIEALKKLKEVTAATAAATATTPATAPAAPTTQQHAGNSAGGDKPRQQEVSAPADAPAAVPAGGQMMPGWVGALFDEVHKDLPPPWAQQADYEKDLDQLSEQELTALADLEFVKTLRSSQLLDKLASYRQVAKHTTKSRGLVDAVRARLKLEHSEVAARKMLKKDVSAPTTATTAAATASGDSRPAAAEKLDPSLPAAAAAATESKPDASQAPRVDLQANTQPSLKADTQQQQQQQQQSKERPEDISPPVLDIPPPAPPSTAAMGASHADVHHVVAADGSTAQGDLQQRKQVQFQPVAVPETALAPAAPAGSGELLSPSSSTVGDAPVDTTGCRPGWGFARPDKEAIVLDGLAQKLSAIVNKQITGAELRSMGLRAVKEARSLRRQYSLWWPGVMSSKEPIHCIPSYHWAAVRLLADAPCREKLGVSLTETALQQAAAAAAASGGSASATAAAAAAAAASAERLPGKRKRARDGVAAAAAAAAAGDDGVDADAEYVPDQRSPKRFKHLHTQSYALQHNAAAAAGAAGAGGPQGVAADLPAAAAAAGGRQRRLAAAGGSTEEVLKSVKHVMEELSVAISAASDVSNLWRKHPQNLPAFKILNEGVDLGTLDSFISDATVLRSELKQDRSIFKQMISAHTAAAAAAAAGVNGSSKTAVAAAKRKPFLAFRDALGTCVADAVAWLQHSDQRRLLDRAQAIVEVRDLYDRYQELVAASKQGGTAPSGPGGLVGVADQQQQQLQQKKKGPKFGPKSPKGKAAAAAGRSAAAAGQLPAVPAAKQQQHHHHHHQQQQHQQQQQQQQQHSEQLGQELVDDELELLQQEQRYNDVVAAAAQAAAAAAAAQDQQQQGPGLAARQGSASSNVFAFLQQFMDD